MSDSTGPQGYDLPDIHQTFAPARSWQLFGSVLGVHLLIAFLVGEVAWDDGYITLAFSRTFAETGHIGLTPLSETVEGATSPLWFLLMAGVYKLGFTSFYGFHLLSQVMVAFCAAASAVMLYRLIRPSVPAASWWIAFLVFVLGAFRTETANGMEMTLLCLVVLGIMVLIGHGSPRFLPGVVFLTVLVPFIRLEAAGYVMAGAIAIVIFSRQLRLGLAIFGSAVVSILSVSVIRYLVFGTMGLTNTMIAKQQPPYSPPFGSQAWNVQLFVTVVVEPLATFLPVLAVAYVLSRLSGIRLRDGGRGVVRLATSRTMPPRMSFGIAYSLGFVLFLFAFGSNYFAPPGRMGSSATLALIVVVAMIFPTAGRHRQPSGKQKMVFATVAAMLLMPFVGVFSQDVAWMYLSRLNNDPKLSFNSTVAYRENGEAADYVRQLLQKPSVSVLLADVGAPSLCCDKLEILDLGLLANTELSAAGWEGFPDYLREKRPDLIQTHGVWSQESGIYENPQFNEDYTPVVVDDSLFFLRNDHFKAVSDRCGKASTDADYFYAGLEPASSKRGGGDARQVDGEYIKSLGLADFCRLR